MQNENLKKPVKFLADSYAEYVRTKEGGFELREIVNFLDELLQLPEVVQSMPQIKQEWKDRTPAAIDELIAYAISSVNLPNQSDKDKFVAVLSLAGAVLKLQLAFAPASVPELPKPIQ